MNFDIYGQVKPFKITDLEESRKNALQLNSIFLDDNISSRYVDLILDLSHAKGSRQLNIIENHVNWIYDKVFKNTNKLFVDIGCGVGFYTHYLSKLGSTGLGIDIMSRAIDYADQHYSSPHCNFVNADFLDFDFPASVDCFLFIYSIFNTLKIEQARMFLKKLYQSLNPGGVFYFEPFKFSSYDNFPTRHWDIFENSLFCENKHLSLYDTIVDSEKKEVIAYTHIVPEDGSLTSYISHIQLYSHQQYEQLLFDAGFSQVEILIAPDFMNKSDDKDYMSIMAIK